MESTRIFVRNLPPTLTDQEFRQHFTKRFTATDLKLFAKRRIGYVGFKTAADAEKAVKYFNKSFIRMSRLHVELAKGVEDAPDRRGEHRTAQTALNTPTAGIPSKLTSPDSSNHAKDQTHTALKRKRDEEDGVTPVAAQTHPSSGERPKAGHEQFNKPAEKTGEEAVDPVQEQSEPARDDAEIQPPSTDTDWMRSRTSRLLGLVDDDVEDSSNALEPPTKAADPLTQSGEEPDTFETQNPEPQEGAEEQIGQLRDKTPKDAPTSSEPDLHGSDRLFLRNLAYSVTESELRGLLQTFGSVSETHVPRDFKSGECKGFAFATMDSAENAANARRSLDGTIFQGRILHLLEASKKRDAKLDEFTMAQLPLKKRRLLEKKSESASSTFNWNSLYMNADAVASSTADRLGVAKSELFDPTSSDAAVKQAQAETHVIQETKEYFKKHGVTLDAFSGSTRDGNCLLVKNFQYKTKATELEKLFAESGDVRRVLMPPSGAIAIVEFANRVQAQAAFAKFSYRKHRDSVLFLEKAPANLFNESADSKEPSSAASNEVPVASTGQGEDAEAFADTTTLFVRNLNFETTTDRLRQIFQAMDGLISARVKTKPDPKHEGRTLSMGFGFLEFRSSDQAKAALLAMQGYELDGHSLEIRASHKGLDAASERRREDKAKRNKLRKSKVVIKNLPFEATKKDVRNLLKGYGQLRTVRLPRKFDNTPKGYAFADFANAKEAENAMDALRNTHLLGRRLVLDYAAGDTEDPEQEIEKMQRKVGKQSESVAMQRLTANERQKLQVEDPEEDASR